MNEFYNCMKVTKKGMIFYFVRGIEWSNHTSSGAVLADGEVPIDLRRTFYAQFIDKVVVEV